MKNITIVTAFYDIGREFWYNYERSNSTYFDCFKRLCCLKNKIIVFTEEKFKPHFDKIIRTNKSDLVVIYEDIFTSNLQLISDIKKCQNNLQSIGGLYDLGRPPEYWNPEYVLINFLKSQFCVSAIEQLDDIDDTVAWIDFGYLKNNKQIPKSNLWKYDFSDKIHLWNIKDIPNELNLFETVRTNTVYIQGCHIVCPKNKWKLFDELMKEQMQYMLSNNIVDDDQTLMLMSYLEYPENFELHKENINSLDLDWFFIFQYYNDMCNDERKKEVEYRK